MKLITIFAAILVATPAVAKPVTFPDESIIVNPAVVCKDLILSSDNFSYDTWRNYQYCIEYMRRFDEAVK